MTRWMWMFVLVAACGTDDGSDTGLACEAVTYCSTWSANTSDVTAPTERGGTIGDGIYRLERGTFQVELLQFAGDHVNAIGDSFENRAGTYTTTNGMISFAYQTRCNSAGTMGDTSTWKDRPYYANGDTLLIAMADSSSGVVWYEYKRVSVEQICSTNANVGCDVTNCSCSVVTDGFGTVSSGVKSCSSN